MNNPFFFSPILNKVDVELLIQSINGFVRTKQIRKKENGNRMTMFFIYCEEKK